MRKLGAGQCRRQGCNRQVTAGLLEVPVRHGLGGIEHRATAKRNDRVGLQANAGGQAFLDCEVGHVCRQVGKGAHSLLDIGLQVRPVQILQGRYREGNGAINAMVAKTGDRIREDVCAPQY
ncbi:hypothetical protein D3C86_1847200 [compost metagenome]